MIPASVDVEVDIVDEFDAASGIDSSDFPRLVHFVLSREEMVGRWLIAIVLTDDERLRELHHRFMGIDTETDVMTFPLEDVPGGDIVISVDRAVNQAADYDHGVGEEVRFLLVHGLLHLCGWDDQTDEARAAMWDRQAAIIDAYKMSNET